MNAQQELDRKKFIDGLGFIFGTAGEQDQKLYDQLWPLFVAEEFDNKSKERE